MGGWVGESRRVRKAIGGEIEKMRESCVGVRKEVFQCLSGVVVVGCQPHIFGGQGWIDLSQSWKESFYKRF